MAHAEVKFFDDGEMELVHEQSLRCLERIGIMVKSQSVLKMLDQKGASVDFKKEVAKIPESMIKEAIRSAPKKMPLGARNPKHNKEIPVETYPLMATTGLAVFTRDIDTGEKRPTTNKDLGNFAKIADAMNGVDICWTTVTAHDVKQEALALNSLWTVLKNNTKHIHVVPATHGAADARKQAELAALVAGGEDKLRKNPLFSVISCSIAPLCFEKAAIEAQAEFGRHGIPVISMSMSLGGLSAPVTIAGTLENINAENLGSLVIQQAAAKGAPFVYSSESAPMDMMTGLMDYNAYQLPLISAGAAQMAKRYGLPSLTSSWGFETKDPGIQTSLSESFGVMFNTFSGTDMMSGAGSLDSAKGAALEQVVLDSSVWEDIRTYMSQFKVTKETIALDVVEAVGHGGTFLKHPHTARNFRTEPRMRDKSRRHWMATLSTSMAPELREIAKRTLKEHQVPALDKDIIKQGDQIVRDYERSLSQV